MRRRRIIFAVLWILSLIAVSIYGGTISYGLFFGMTFIPVISAVYLLYVYFKFLIYQEVIVKNVVCEQAIPYYFVLQNDDFVVFTKVSVRLFSDFSYVEQFPDHHEYELLPGDKIRYDTKLTCKYRGEYKIGVKEIVITDFFDLFQLKYKVPSPIKATVFPQVIQIRELKSILEISTFLQKEAAVQNSEPDAVVRDYVQGDSLKRIHWKATAKEQKLKVRQVIGEEKQGITILYDTARFSDRMQEYLPAENKILEILLALGFFFAGNHIEINTVCEQRGMTQIRLVNSTKSFENLYQDTANLQFEKENSFQKLLLNVVERGVTSACKAVFMILQKLDGYVLQTADTLSAKGIIVVLYIITDQDISSYVMQGNARMKIVAIPKDGRLEELL